MKQYSKLFSLVALLGVTSGMLHARDNDDNNNGNRVVPFLQWRSQGRDMARKLYGTTSWAVYQPDMDGRYGTFNVTVQYDQSFRNSRIADCLFGPAVVANTTTSTNKCDNDCDDSAVIMISGLQAPNLAGTTTRGPRELMAENFLLPRDYRSVISFSPKVQDVVVDFNLFVGLDRWVDGLYFRLYGPVVWNKVNLRANETVVNATTASSAAIVDPVTGNVSYATLGGGYQQGFFDVNAPVPTQALFSRALQFFGGCPFPDKYTVPTGRTAPTVQPLRFAKFSDCITGINSCDDDCNGTSRHKTGFAELRGEFGYNYIRENYRFLINLQAAAPTGTKIKAEYLFPAYVGNGHHWELGVGLGGAWKMWCNEDAEKSFNFIVEADITHLFKAKQQRTFDLKCKPLSRYMLAERLSTVPAANADSQLIPNTPIFSAGEAKIFGEYAPVANFSTRDVKVSIGVQGDLVAMFNYTCRGFSWDLGYNFWAMSSSKISVSCDNDDCDDSCNPVVPFLPNTWALKGDASVGGYSLNAGGTAIEGIYGLGATETGTTANNGGATIFAGVNATNVNNNIDNAQLAFANDGATPAGQIPLFAFSAAAPFQRINTSVDPKFISIDDLDIEGAEQRGLSHKVFTHFSYTWRDCSDRWMPYVGAGFSAEFGSHSGGDDDCNNTTPTCDPCPSSLSCALSKWAVEIKGGVSFH